jgi:hypothetical protein
VGFEVKLNSTNKVEKLAMKEGEVLGAFFLFFSCQKPHQPEIAMTIVEAEG